MFRSDSEALGLHRRMAPGRLDDVAADIRGRKAVGVEAVVKKAAPLVDERRPQ